MGIWNLYFILKLYLYLTHRIGFDWLLNGLFAIFLILPVRHKNLRIVRQLIALPLGLALLYHDSYWLPFTRVWAQLPQLKNFSFEYWQELALRIASMLDLKIIVAIVFLCLLYFVANRFLRMTAWVIVALLVIPASLLLHAYFFPGPSVASGASGSNLSELSADANFSMPASAAPADLQKKLDGFLLGFYQKEATRVAAPAEAASTSTNTFTAHVATAANSTAPAFDIILLHICSLAWSDLEQAHLRNHRLLSRFDLVFKNFNSAVSYSTPAAIRLLRANCGQTSHDALYQKTYQACYLMSSLQQAGYMPQMLLNHDGRYNDFAAGVQDNFGLAVKPIVFDGLTAAMRSFDGSPVLRDIDVLSHWWQQTQQAQPAIPRALYYNSISLHDGTRILGDNANSQETYPQRLQNLLDDIDRFISIIEQSGHKTVVVFVPEHGAAYHADSRALAGLREIPAALVTHVPAGIKLVGWSHAPTMPVVVEQPTSYLALAQLLMDFVQRNPFSADNFSLEDYARHLPVTQPVGENQGVVVLQAQKPSEKSYVKFENRTWEELQ